MFKFIFYTILVIACAYFFSDVFIESGTMLAEALSGVNVAFSVILSIIIVPFTTMLDFYYIKLALYIGLLIFSLSYVMKWLTGHHLTTEEDIEEVNYLDEKPILKLSMPTRTKDIYSSKQTYDMHHDIKVKYAKNQNTEYENSLRKQKIKNAKHREEKSYEDLKREFEEWRKKV